MYFCVSNSVVWGETLKHNLEGNIFILWRVWWDVTEAAWMSFWRPCPKGSMSSTYFISLELLPLSSPITCPDLCHSKVQVLFLVMPEREKPWHECQIHSCSQFMSQQLCSKDHQHNHPSPHPQPCSTISFLVNSSSLGTGCSQRLQQMERPLRMGKGWEWLDGIWKVIHCKEVWTRGKRENKPVLRCL